MGERRAEAAHGLDPRGRDRDRELGGLALHRIEPMRVQVSLLEQAVARAQRPLERRDPAAVAGIDREHQPVEEAPPLRARPGEQLIHGRHQPHHAQMIGKGRGGRHRLAIDAALAGPHFGLAQRPLDPGTERGEPERTLDFRRDRPGAVAFRERQVFERRPAQAAARRQQRDRLEQIGFSRAVRAQQHRRPAVGRNLRGAIAAEIAQHQAADARRPRLNSNCS